MAGLRDSAQGALRRIAGGAPEIDSWWRRLWREHPTYVGAAIVLAAAAVGLGGYLLLKRPADVSDPDAAFVDPSAEQRETDARRNWPTYGLNEARTRFLPASRVRPPYRIVWRFKARALVEYSPIVVHKTMYGINNNGETFAINLTNGNARWRRDVAQLNASAPTWHDGRLYISNLDPGQVISLGTARGRTLWRHPLPGRTESSPIVTDRLVIVGCECGSLFALNRRTGHVVWETEIGGAIKGAPALADGVIYVGAYGGTVAAVRLNGSIKWTSDSQSQGLGQTGNFYATPAVAYGRVYVGNTDGRMYSFEKETGDLAWSHSTGDYVYAAAAAADTTETPPTVYFGSYDGTFYALDAKSGDERWTQDVGGPVSGAASVIGHVVYVATLNDTVSYGFNVEGGRRVFAFRDGAYNPVISNGLRLFVTGKRQIYAMKHVDESPKRPKVFGANLEPPRGKRHRSG